MMVMAVQRPAQAAEAVNAATSCVDSSLFDQMAEVDKGLDDAQSVYHQYLQWVTLAQNRTALQSQIADHRTALQELRDREVKVIASLSKLYSNGDVAFQTGADGKGYEYTNKKSHKGVQPFFPKDLGGEDGTDWNDLINDERTQTSKTLATFIAGVADTDARASMRYCAANAPSNSASALVKGMLGLMKPNFCMEETQQCTTTTVQTPVVVTRPPSQNSTPTLIPQGGSRFRSNNPGINNLPDSSDDDTGSSETTYNTTNVETCVCVVREKPNCIAGWAQGFGGQVYQWNEQRKKELDLRGQSVQTMRSLDELNALGRSLQQAMIAQGATGITGSLSDDDLKSKFLAFHPARYTAIYNQLAQLRQDPCAKRSIRPLTDLYQRVTAEARQYDVTLLPTGDEVGSTLVEPSSMVAAIQWVTNLTLQPEDFAKMRQGNCGPTASCVESDKQNRCQRYVYDIPSTIAWVQQNAGAIAGNKARFRQLTCGDATYPLP